MIHEERKKKQIRHKPFELHSMSFNVGMINEFILNISARRVLLINVPKIAHGLDPIMKLVTISIPSFALLS